MKQDGSALTRIEAAMCGLWLMGAGWVLFEQTEPGIDAHISDRDNLYWFDIECIFYHHNAPNDIPMSDVAILPWLESHGITPPEVEG